ncbi:hypothetical protein M569_04909, partial [Genlisea aurea]
YRHSKISSTSRSRKSSALPIAMYLILLFAMSCIVFMTYTKDILLEEHQLPLLRTQKSKSNQV